MWMCKYRSCSQDPNTYGNNDAQLPITINIILKCVETIAMIRIWVYFIVNFKNNIKNL